jgi:DnaJ-domain-containing protein 1
VLLALSRGAAALLALLPLLRELRGERASAHHGQAGGAGRHAEPGAEEARRPGRMTRREALEILGLDSGATPEDVQREYRRLIKKIHPDLGGSSYLAAKVNEAKDVLS